jgi:hypothetical protein
MASKNKEAKVIRLGGKVNEKIGVSAFRRSKAHDPPAKLKSSIWGIAEATKKDLSLTIGHTGLLSWS